MAQQDVSFPLHEAAAQDQLPDSLTAASARAVDDVGATLLHRAAQGAALNATRALLGLGAEVGAREAAGATPLHYAALAGGGISAAGDDKQNWAAEFPHLVRDEQAVVAGAVGVVEELVGAGGERTAVDGSGNTPVHGQSFPASSHVCALTPSPLLSLAMSIPLLRY